MTEWRWMTAEMEVGTILMMISSWTLGASFEIFNFGPLLFNFGRNSSSSTSVYFDEEFGEAFGEEFNGSGHHL
jgi:hypothetical protein